MFWKSIFVAVMVLLASSVCSDGFSPVVDEGSVAKNGQQALEIAQKYVSEKYEQNFDDYNIIIMLHDDIWIVGYSPPGKGRFVMGGGGPQVEIKKSNGEVVRCLLQR